MPDGFVPSWSYLCSGERTRPENQGMDRGRYGKENSTGIFVNKREGNENMMELHDYMRWEEKVRFWREAAGYWKKEYFKEVRKNENDKSTS